MKHLFITPLILFCLAKVGLAQQEMTLHLMNNIYQSSHTNPAHLPGNKVNVSLPVLSSVRVGVKNSGFALQDFVTFGENKTTIDLERLSGTLNNREVFYTGMSTDLFALKFPVNDNNWISFHISEHMHGRFGYGSGFLNLITEGNPVGETMDLGGYKLNAMHYREYSTGYTRKIPGLNLVIGGDLKIVYGKANIFTQRSELTLNTADESDLYRLTGSADYLVNVGGVDPENYKINPANYLMNNANAGLGLDLGATYQFSEKLSFGASLINLGYIKWTDHVKNYKAQGEFEFDGFNYNDILNSENSGFNQSDITDSLDQIIDVTEDTSAYTSPLPAEVYLTGNYQLAPNTTASAVIHGDFLGKLRGGVALGIQQKVGNALNVAATYSIQNRSANNIGLGLMLKPGPFQFYMTGDNFLSLIRPAKSKMFSARLGMNLVFGKID